MNTGSIIVIGAGLLTTACGIALQPALRRPLVMIGAIQLSFGAYLVLQDMGSAAKYAALAAVAVLVCIAFVSAGTSLLGRLRPELSLAAAAVIGILASTSWRSAPLQAQRTLVMAVGCLTAAFIGLTLLRFGKIVLVDRRRSN